MFRRSESFQIDFMAPILPARRASYPVQLDGVVRSLNCSQIPVTLGVHAREERDVSNHDRVRTLIENWARAVSAGDRKAILAHHSPDVVMFDFPNEIRGLDAYDKTWDFFFANPKGPIVFEPRQIEVTSGEDVAFAVCMFHCDGTSGGSLDFRLTSCLRKEGTEWVIVHEHHSVRTVEQRFIDAGGKR